MAICFSFVLRWGFFTTAAQWILSFLPFLLIYKKLVWGITISVLLQEVEVTLLYQYSQFWYLYGTWPDKTSIIMSMFQGELWFVNSSAKTNLTLRDCNKIKQKWLTNMFYILITACTWGWPTVKLFIMIEKSLVFE